jgi:hypothetical protein
MRSLRSPSLQGGEYVTEAGRAWHAGTQTPLIGGRPGARGLDVWTFQRAHVTLSI